MKYIKIIILPILILITSIIILITNIPHLEYQYSEEYEGYLITKAVGNAEYYNIPNYYKDKPVVGISENAFNGHSNLKEIELPSNLYFIGRMSFNECISLEKINLDNVEEIQRNAFSYCSNLKELNINAKYIGASCFYKCKNLENIYLNNTISIGDMCFSNTIIKTISIPKTCTYLGNDSFYECYALKEINVYSKYLKNNTYLNSLTIVNYIGN